MNLFSLSTDDRKYRKRRRAFDSRRHVLQLEVAEISGFLPVAEAIIARSGWKILRIGVSLNVVILDGGYTFEALYWADEKRFELG